MFETTIKKINKEVPPESFPAIIITCSDNVIWAVCDSRQDYLIALQKSICSAIILSGFEKIFELEWNRTNKQKIKNIKIVNGELSFELESSLDSFILYSNINKRDYAIMVKYYFEGEK